MIRARRRFLALAALVSLAACATSRPPFTQPPGASATADPHQAALVFLWPMSGCDPAGYFTLATADGKFIGNIARGSRVSVSVPAGETTVVGWNEVVESVSGARSNATVPVLHADLREGRTYYVRMLFGDWDVRGPRESEASQVSVRGSRLMMRRMCMEVPESATSAMVGLTPASEEWRELPAWIAELDAIVPDRAAGQAWLDGNRESLVSHVAVAQNRFVGMRPLGRKLATLEPADGAPP